MSMPSSQEVDPLSDPDEARHLHAVLDSFRQYRSRTHFATTHVRRQSFYALPQSHWQTLAAPPINYLDTLTGVDECIDANADIADAIYSNALASIDESDDDVKPWHGTATALDHQKARSTLNQLHRDWSAEGLPERAAVFTPIFSALASEPSISRGCKILVPGAGLGRLVLELAARGYTAEGNELSYHQLFASQFVLNACPAPDMYSIYPFCGNFSNRARREDQFRACKVPDVAPSAVMAEAGEGWGSMSMSSGDFCEVYGTEENQGTWDAVVSCFFIDTAPDFLRYVEVVRGALRQGGLWVNVGPLLWHFDADQTDGDGDDEEGTSDEARRKKLEDGKIGSHGSFELSDDEVVKLLGHYGFEILRHEEPSAGRETGYIDDETSMLQHKYRPSFWVARKK